MGTRVFVGNVNPQTRREELERFFSRVGRVHSVYIPLDRETGHQRGFAFVDYADGASAERAIEQLDGALLGGRKLRLSWAFEKPSKPRAGRFGRPPAPPTAADPDPLEWSADDSDPATDYDAASQKRRRRGGKHGSDRKHGQGTRRFIE